MTAYKTLDEARDRVEAWCAKHDVDAVDGPDPTDHGLQMLFLARGEATGEVKFGPTRWLQMATCLDADDGAHALEVIHLYEGIYGRTPREYGEAR